MRAATTVLVFTSGQLGRDKNVIKRDLISSATDLATRFSASCPRANIGINRVKTVEAAAAKTSAVEYLFLGF